MKMKQKIRRIRDQLVRRHYPMPYEPSLPAENCYAYALGSTFKDNDTEAKYVFNLGALSKMYFPDTKEQAEEALKADMKELGISCEKSYYEEKLEKDEWKIALFFYDEPGDEDFHLMREDSDGYWSHKVGLDGPINKIYGSLEYAASNYDIVGYFKLKVIA